MKTRFIITKKWLPMILTLLLAVSMGAIGQDSNPVVEKSFEVKEGGLLTVNSEMGSIRVESGNSDMVEVRVLRNADSWSSEEGEAFLKEFQVDFSQSGNDVTVKARFKDSWEHRHGNYSVRFECRVPAKYNVDLNTSGGSISVDDLEGKVEAETAGGSLSFGNIKGPVNGRTAGGNISLDGGVATVDVKTAGGSIKIGEVDGDISARTSGGSISIDRAKGSVMAETSGGSIKVEEVMGNIEASTSGGSVSATISKQPKGDCRLETSAGSVTVYLADDVAVDVNAHASWGKIECEFPVTTSGTLTESSLQGKINGGGPELYLRTSSGKVRIRKM
jgi:hypothetical protein